MLGATVSVALMLGLLAALVPAFVLLARHGSAARKMGVPLVPFLSLGAVVALFAGERLLDGYLGLLLEQRVKAACAAADNPFEG